MIRKSAILQLDSGEELEVSASEIHADPPSRQLRRVSVGNLGYCTIHDFEEWAEEVKGLITKTPPESEDPGGAGG